MAHDDVLPPPPSRRRAFLRAYPWLVLAVAVALAAIAIAAGGDTPRDRAEAAAAADVEAFVQPGCRHCEAALAFLDVLVAERAGTKVHRWDLVRDPAARRRLEHVADEAGVRVAGTPALRVRGTLIVGWRATTGDRVRAILVAPTSAPAEPSGGGQCPLGPEDEEVDPPASDCSTPLAAPEEETVDVPWIGTVRSEEVGLVAFTLVVGLVDGFNPCAMWVLLFVLSLLVHTHSRARMFAVAGTFVLASGVCYFAFMAAWLTLFDVVGHLRLVQVALGALGVFVGAIHAKDFFAFREGLTLSIPESRKPGLIARVTAALRARRLAGAVAGMVVLAFLVNVVEILCTAGLPALYTSVLSQHDLTRLETYAFLALYQVAYMLDDAVVLAVAIVTLSHAKLQVRGGRWLKLASGVVILVLGLLLLFRPEVLYG